MRVSLSNVQIHNIDWIIVFFLCSISTTKNNYYASYKKKSNVEQNQTLFSLGYMSGYDVWEFLKEQPAEKEVIVTLHDADVAEK